MTATTITTRRRNRKNSLAGVLLHVGAIVSLLSVVILLLSVLNNAFGLVLLEYATQPDRVYGTSDPKTLERSRLEEILSKHLTERQIRQVNVERPIAERDADDLLGLIDRLVLAPHILEAWTLEESLFQQDSIYRIHSSRPGTVLQFRSWLSRDFLTAPQHRVPQFAGIRTALLGSLWILAVITVVALPVGLGTAIYLEEYAHPERWYNRLIELNIESLAGVPSVIFGLLGLAIFVPALAPLGGDGRNVLSAGLTLSILVLPVVITESRVALREVPGSLRLAGISLGASRWQTLRYHLLPASMGRIVSAMILALSRAFGEAAPLIVLGTSAFLSSDPVSLFSRAITLPVQVFQWTLRPQSQFRNSAAAAIIVLLVLSLLLNGSAALVAHRSSKRRHDKK
jgi:phosphate transport system permease protein